MKKVAVVILNWNGLDLMKEFLPSICAHTPTDIADVVVADNGSTDGSVEWLKRNHPDVILLEMEENHGYARGYNLAIKKLPYSYVVLLNSDVEASPDWLTPLFDFCESHPDVGACQPKLLAYRDKKAFEYAGAAGGFLDKYGYPYCRGRIFFSIENDEGQYDSPAEIFWATGACLFIRREVYLKAGGLDESFFAHMEEIDLCWRVKLLGYKIYTVPQSHMYHLGGATLSASEPRKTYLNFRNNLLMLYKNLPKNEGRRILIIRRLLDTIALARYIAGGEWQHARAVWLAHNQHTERNARRPPEHRHRLFHTPKTHLSPIAFYRNNIDRKINNKWLIQKHGYSIRQPVSIQNREGRCNKCGNDGSDLNETLPPQNIGLRQKKVCTEKGIYSNAWQNPRLRFPKS